MVITFLELVIFLMYLILNFPLWQYSSFYLQIIVFQSGCDYN